jgi:hypothetical protein
MPNEEVLTKRPGQINDLKVVDVFRIGTTPLYPYTTAITSGSTATTKAAGSLAITSHATGRGIVFYSDGSFWVNSATTGPISTAQQTALDLKAPLASPVFTTAVTLPAVVNTALPTSDPVVAGRLWSDAGAVKVSAGA